MPAITITHRRGARDLPCDCGCGAKIKPTEPIVVHVYGRNRETVEFYKIECWSRITKEKENIK